MARDDGAPPPFLTKTFEMVDDPATNAVVAWSGDDSFIVKDPGQFSTNILPCYFKHNNLSSFVRQLNIYGFRKVNSDCWEFSHPHFRRGWFDSLREIKRRKTSSRSTPSQSLDVMRQHIQGDAGRSVEGLVANSVLSDGRMLPTNSDSGRQIASLLEDKETLIAEVVRLRKQQDATHRMLAATLNELHETRCEQQRTQETLEKVVNFLSSLVEGQQKSLQTQPETKAKKESGQPDEAAMLRESSQPMVPLEAGRGSTPSALSIQWAHLSALSSVARHARGELSKLDTTTVVRPPCLPGDPARLEPARLERLEQEHVQISKHEPLNEVEV